MQHELTQIIWNMFEKENFLIDYESYSTERKIVTGKGIEELHFLFKFISEKSLTKCLSKYYDHPVDECIRILGFGYSLSAFLVAPLNLSKSARQSICRLGAILNLTITLFDLFIDSGFNSQ